MLNNLTGALWRFLSEPSPLAAVSNETAAAIRDSALNSPHMDILLRVGLVLGGIFLLFCLFTLVRYLLSSRKNFVPAGWISAPQEIRSLLNIALAQRSTMELQFIDKHEERRPILRCSLEEVEPGRICIEAYGVSGSAPNWGGRALTCYFKIKLKDQSVYYTFNSRVQTVEARAHGVSALWLEFPERVQNRQKRAFLRIHPPEEYFLGAALWFGPCLPAEERLANLESWRKPGLALLPGKERQFYIKDVSAGGVRLRVPRLEKGHEFSVSERVVLLLDLLEPEQHQRQRFWLLCRVQNLIADYNNQSFDLGMQFMAWAATREGNDSLEWLKLTREREVAPLGNWIVRRHMEFFRNNPELR